MRPREPRLQVMVRARMRLGAGWSDVCILNISTRGIGMQSAAPPARGAYVEVRRGRHVIIGCVAWSKGRRFGLHTQDCVEVEAIVRDPGPAGTMETAAAPRGARERRAAPRPRPEAADRSRVAGRALEFACVAIFGFAAAMVALETVEQALARPLTMVSASLDQ